MLVYRVEKTDGTGPYVTTPKILPWSWHLGTDRLTHPTPWEDFGVRKIEMVRGKIFGFDSIKKLYEWFYHRAVLEVLRENDFIIGVYEVSETMLHRGSRQVMFFRENADCVDNLQIDIDRARQTDKNPYLVGDD